MLPINIPYTQSLKLRDIIADNSLLLMAISRFGLPLRLANQSVGEVCSSAGVDTATFLAVANMISGKPFDGDAVRLDSPVAYLRRAHSYFLDFFLPSIRRKFIIAVDFSKSNDVARVYCVSSTNMSARCEGIWTMKMKRSLSTLTASCRAARFQLITISRSSRRTTMPYPTASTASKMC